MERSDKEIIEYLRMALEEIANATWAEFQLETDPAFGFRPKRDACPLCRRASTAEYLKKQWALIQAISARALRDTE